MSRSTDSNRVFYLQMIAFMTFVTAVIYRLASDSPTKELMDQFAKEFQNNLMAALPKEIVPEIQQAFNASYHEMSARFGMEGNSLNKPLENVTQSLASEISQNQVGTAMDLLSVFSGNTLAEKIMGMENRFHEIMKTLMNGGLPIVLGSAIDQFLILLAKANVDALKTGVMNVLPAEGTNQPGMSDKQINAVLADTVRDHAVGNNEEKNSLNRALWARGDDIRALFLNAQRQGDVEGKMHTANSGTMKESINNETMQKIIQIFQDNLSKMLTSKIPQGQKLKTGEQIIESLTNTQSGIVQTALTGAATRSAVSNATQTASSKVSEPFSSRIESALGFGLIAASITTGIAAALSYVVPPLLETGSRAYTNLQQRNSEPIIQLGNSNQNLEEPLIGDQTHQEDYIPFAQEVPHSSTSITATANLRIQNVVKLLIEVLKSSDYEDQLHHLKASLSVVENQEPNKALSLIVPYVLEGETYTPKNNTTENQKHALDQIRTVLNSSDSKVKITTEPAKQKLKEFNTSVDNLMNHNLGFGLV